MRRNKSVYAFRSKNVLKDCLNAGVERIVWSFVGRCLIPHLWSGDGERRLSELEDSSYMEIYR